MLEWMNDLAMKSIRDIEEFGSVYSIDVLFYTVNVYTTTLGDDRRMYFRILRCAYIPESDLCLQLCYKCYIRIETMRNATVFCHHQNERASATCLGLSIMLKGFWKMYSTTVATRFKS